MRRNKCLKLCMTLGHGTWPIPGERRTMNCWFVPWQTSPAPTFSKFPSQFSQAGFRPDSFVGWSCEHTAFDPEQLIFHKDNRELGYSGKSIKFYFTAQAGYNYTQTRGFPGQNGLQFLQNHSHLGQFSLLFVMQTVILHPFWFLDIIANKINYVFQEVAAWFHHYSKPDSIYMPSDKLYLSIDLRW